MNAKRAGILELSDSAGAQGVEVTLDRTEHEHVVDGRSVECVERVRRSEVTQGNVVVLTEDHV
jgi:hypothetical protein